MLSGGTTLTLTTVFLLFLFFLGFEAKIQNQCLCEPYKKCTEHTKIRMSFPKCLKTCKEREVPEKYVKCLRQFEHLLTNTIKCTFSNVGSGCTNHEKNVINRRNFTVFQEIFRKEFAEIAEKVGSSFVYTTKAAEKMNSCVLGCFYPAENACSRKQRCGLFMPSELRLMDNLSKCALTNDVSKGIMMEIATCMRLVTKSPDQVKNEKEEYAAEEYAYTE